MNHARVTVETDVAWCPTCATHTHRNQDNPTDWATTHTTTTGHLTYQRQRTLTTRTTKAVAR